MYVIAIHSISDPDAFWGGKLHLPDCIELPTVAPNADEPGPSASGSRTRSTRFAHAEPGGILVSGAVKDLVVGSEIKFVPRGSHELKGASG